MNAEHTSDAPAFGPREVLLILLRNKWTIVLSALLGLGAAAVLYSLMAPSYQSTAKLYVRYIMEQPAGVPGEAVQVRAADSRGDGLMATEAEILGSWDLVTAVVSAIGAERILGETGLTNAALAAAAQVRQNLKVELAGKGSVITLTYSNLRPDVPQVVLEEIVKQYRERHIMAHSSEGSYDSLLRETDAMSARIKETQTKLTDLKVRLGVTTLAETKTQLSGQIVALETDIVRIRAQLAESEARFAELQRGRLGDADTNAPVVLPAPVDPAVVEQYRGAGLRLDRQRLQELELVGQYADAHPQVRQIREQIAATEREKRTLEEAHPGLLVVRSELAGADSARAAVVDHSRERAAIAASRAHLQSLETRLDELNNRRSEISASENELADLERGLQLDERSYEQSLIALRGARFNEALDPSKMPNINVLQNPTVPLRAAGKRAKTCGAVAVAGLAIGMGLAFLREVVFDQSIRSPLEIENRLHLPMFLSIPLLSDRQPVKLLGSGAAQEDADHAPQPERAPWEISHFIRPYCDALRDRLIMYFQLKNIHHKPKLVAVTSCSEGAGTTTVAAALAASLSETGDGKVLLVDMNVGRPEMHPFFRGNLASSLTDLFQTGGDTQQGRYDNLYLATGTERNGELTPLVPAKFYELLPRMRSSDFDYIIFDMPPIRQTSATVALSGLMDKVLLLVEPGKTNRDAVKRATDLMRQQHADVAGVVNRLPKSSLKWLQPELE